MKDVYILDARRTPIGRFLGGLADHSALELGRTVADAMLPEALRTEVEQVIIGQVLQAGCGMNVARQMALALQLGQQVPAFTVNMVCGSSLKAVMLATDAIRCGDAELVLAGGVESMSCAPHYQRALRSGKKLGDAKLEDAIMADGLTDPTLGVGMGETAERIAEKLGISREAQDAFALQSQKRVEAAREALANEIVPVGDVMADEHPRASTTLDGLAGLRPAFRKDGTVTAGNASGINDGAAMILLASESAMQRFNLKPMARVVSSASVGCDPSLMGLGPVEAIRRAVDKAGWRLSELDCIELNEAFAAQVLGCCQQLDISPESVNKRGGAIALGHPIGASGARVLTTLVHQMRDNKLSRGVASLCVGGGMGVATVIEAL